MHTDIVDVLIIGSGPAGLTAATYTSRASLSTVLIAGSKWGGQLMLTTEVENFPGFPKGIQGPELMGHMRSQAERFGTTVVDELVTAVDFSKRPFSVSTSSSTYKASSVIVATGADTKWLGVKGEQEFIGKGVSSCAPCDAFFYKGKNVIVVGGGDSAMEEALVLTKFANSVTIVHRKDSFRASQIMQERVLHHPKITVLWNMAVGEIMGDKKVTGVLLEPTAKNQKPTTLSIDGVFVAIGHSPNTSLFADVLKLDEKGYIRKIPNAQFQLTNRTGEVIGNTYPSMSTVEGVFIAGDVQDYQYRQAITAAGYGCMAALDTEKWLREQGE